MNPPRLVSLLGLGFGDCGKGLFTDFLCRRFQAHTTIRFNGGAQAGHNVVLPDGRHHTFSQFGAGTFIPNVFTVLAYPVVLHPTALLVEHEHLRTLGIHDCLARLLIDGRCRVTTPFHQASGRLRELARGGAAHGSCGVGVGETVLHDLRAPEQTLRYSDLLRPSVARYKLAAIRASLVKEWRHGPQDATESRIMTDPQVAERWLERAAELVRFAPPASKAQIAERLNAPGTVLFEGAQSILLDEWLGFHPHTTWSRVHPDAVESVAVDADLAEVPIEHFGVLRSYLTRHGRGPLPTHDENLSCLPEPHNTEDGWQGAFRRGHPDAVLLDYATKALGKLDGLLLSHLDLFDRLEHLRWCSAYTASAHRDDVRVCERRGEHIERLNLGPQQDLEHQAALTQILERSSPVFDSRPVTSAADLVERVEGVAKCPVLFGASGPTHANVTSWRDERS